jgi:hypothetical protein
MQSQLKGMESRLACNKKSVKLLLSRKESLLRRRLALLKKSPSGETAKEEGHAAGKVKARPVEELGSELEAMDQVMKVEEQQMARNYEGKCKLQSKLEGLRRKLEGPKEAAGSGKTERIGSGKYEHKGFGKFGKMYNRQRENGVFKISEGVEKNPRVLSHALSKPVPIPMLTSCPKESLSHSGQLKNKHPKVDVIKKPQNQASYSTFKSNLKPGSPAAVAKHSADRLWYDSLDSVSVDDALDQIKAKSSIDIPKLPAFGYEKLGGGNDQKGPRCNAALGAANINRMALRNPLKIPVQNSRIQRSSGNIKFIALAEPVLQFRSRRGKLEGEAPVMMASRQSSTRFTSSRRQKKPN